MLVPEEYHQKYGTCSKVMKTSYVLYCVKIYCKKKNPEVIKLISPIIFLNYLWFIAQLLSRNVFEVV